MVASHYASKISWLKQLLSHVDWDTRESIACLLGIVSSALPIPTASDVILELTSLFSQTHKSRFVYWSCSFLGQFLKVNLFDPIFYICSLLTLNFLLIDLRLSMVRFVQ